jgi:hypothetical protein
VVVIELRGPFAAADLASVGARADDLDESALLRSGGRRAESARLPATDPAGGAGTNPEVGLDALFPTTSAGTLGVHEGGARLLFGKPFAIQEQEEIRQGVVEPEQIVAQRADSRVTSRA